MPASISSTDRIPLDASLRVGIQRTLRIPDDGRTYPLPPALGRLPVRPADPRFEPFSRPAKQAGRDGIHFLVPMHRHEAAWLQFTARPSDPHAVKIGVGRVDALTGLPWDEVLRTSPQNYIVCPYQPWIDGFKTGPSIVRQFVAVPLGAGLTVEHQITAQESGGISIACFRPKTLPSTMPDMPHVKRQRTRELGLGAGGRIQQRIYPDPFGIDTWMSAPVRVIRIHLVEAAEYSRITGEAVPPSPVDAATYTRFGLPWFEVYDSARGDIPATPSLSKIQSVEDLSGVRVPGAQDGRGTAAPRPHQIRPIPPRSRRKR